MSDRKLKIYLDTSVVSYLQQEDVPDRMAETLKLWKKFMTGCYDIYLSSMTTYEIDNCSESIKDANDKILKNNESSFTKYYEHSNVALDTFITTYKNPNATQAEKKFAAENMQKILDRDYRKDDKVRENNYKICL